jgi:hypothetical protein
MIKVIQTCGRLSKRICRAPQCAASRSGTVSSTFLNISDMPLGSRRQRPIGSSFTPCFQMGDRPRKITALTHNAVGGPPRVRFAPNSDRWRPRRNMSLWANSRHSIWESGQLLLETEPTGDNFERFTRHVQVIHRGLLILIAARHSAGDDFIGP